MPESGIYTYSECKKEKFGIGGTAILNSNNHFNVETLVGLPGPIQRAISMLSLYNTLKTRANNRYDISLYQLFFEADIVKYLLKTPVGRDSEPKSKDSVSTVANKLGLDVFPMPKDGDCFFKSIAFNILNIRPNSALEGHLRSLGLFNMHSTEQIAMKLRSMMVQELISNTEAKYIGFMEQCEKDRYEERVQQFLQPGVFSGDVGDLMVKATVNVLKIPVTLLTSMENYPIINITPEEFAKGCRNDCLFVAYSREGPGHYDAVIESGAGRQGGKTADWLSKMTQWALLNSNAPARAFDIF